MINLDNVENMEKMVFEVLTFLRQFYKKIYNVYAINIIWEL